MKKKAQHFNFIRKIFVYYFIVHFSQVFLNPVPGPPRNLQIQNITDKSIWISWKPPQTISQIQTYEVALTVLHTFASYIPESPSWSFSSSALENELLVHPGTRYNVTVEAVTSTDVHGVPAHKEFESQIGGKYAPSPFMEFYCCQLVPDVTPRSPKVEKRKRSTIEVNLSPVTNNNGPVSAYRVAVVDTSFRQVLSNDDFTSYAEAKERGLGYYVTAEIRPEVFY